MYRFVLSPRWLGLGLLMTLAAVVMVGLGQWQLGRYHERSAVNSRVDNATATAPAPLAQVLAGPGTAKVGPPPTEAVAWTRVTVTGRYDPTHEILARARTVADSVGFEVLTPLVLPDGTAVLVDRGWLAPSASSGAVAPNIPPAPTGEVTVIGRVHAPESRPTAPEPFAGMLAVRRIAPEVLAPSLPYPLYGAYITLESQNPPADAAFRPIPPDHQNAAMNAGYVVQWWMFAALSLVGFCYLVVREARTTARTAAASKEPLNAQATPAAPGRAEVR